MTLTATILFLLQISVTDAQHIQPSDECVIGTHCFKTVKTKSKSVYTLFYDIMYNITFDVMLCYTGICTVPLQPSTISITVNYVLLPPSGEI